jgi:hypothetical protein
VRLAKPPMFQLTTRFASVALVVFKVSHPILYEHHDDKIIMIMIMKNTKSRKLPSMGSLWFCGCECVLFFFFLLSLVMRHMVYIFHGLFVRCWISWNASNSIDIYM